MKPVGDATEPPKIGFKLMTPPKGKLRTIVRRYYSEVIENHSQILEARHGIRYQL